MQVVKSGRTESVIASVREAEAGLMRVAVREAAQGAQD